MTSRPNSLLCESPVSSELGLHDDSPPASPTTSAPRVAPPFIASTGRKSSVCLQLFKATTTVDRAPNDPRRPRGSTAVVAHSANPPSSWTSILHGASVVSPNVTSTAANHKGKQREDDTFLIHSPFASPDPTLITHPRSPYATIARSPRRVQSPSPRKRPRSPNRSSNASNASSAGVASGLSSSRPASPHPGSGSTLRSGGGESTVPEFILPKAALSPSTISTAIAYSPSPSSLFEKTPSSSNHNSPRISPNEESIPSSFLPSPLAPSSTLDLSTPDSPPLDPAKSNAPTPKSLPAALPPLARFTPSTIDPVPDTSTGFSTEELVDSLRGALEEVKLISADEAAKASRDEGLFSQTDGEESGLESEEEDDDWSDDEDEESYEESDYSSPRDEDEDDDEPHEHAATQTPAFAYSVNVGSLSDRLNEGGENVELGVTPKLEGEDLEGGRDLRRTVTVPLEPFDHQVGGHSHIFRFSKKAVCKVRSFVPHLRAQSTDSLWYDSRSRGGRTNSTKRSNDPVPVYSLSFRNISEFSTSPIAAPRHIPAPPPPLHKRIRTNEGSSVAAKETKEERRTRRFRKLFSSGIVISFPRAWSGTL